MFGLFGGKRWKSSHAHLLLLSKFLRGDSSDDYASAEHWESVLKEKPGSVIQRFLKEGMLEPAWPAEALDCKCKTAELKGLLRERNLKVSGTKHELIGRLISGDTNGMEKLSRQSGVLRCSDKGRQLAGEFLEKQEQERKQSETKVLNLLRGHEFRPAAQLVAKYEASQVFPRGLGMDWGAYDPAPDVELLQSIFGKTPRILDGIEKQRLEPLRVATGMAQLWGTNNVEPWLPDGFEIGIHLDVDAAARMLIFYASHLCRVKQYSESGVKTVTIFGVDDSAMCSQCREIQGKRYPVADVPELPYPECTSDMGCRCTILPDIP